MLSEKTREGYIWVVIIGYFSVWTVLRKKYSFRDISPRTTCMNMRSRNSKALKISTAVMQQWKPSVRNKSTNWRFQTDAWSDCPYLLMYSRYYLLSAFQAYFSGYYLIHLEFTFHTYFITYLLIFFKDWKLSVWVNELYIAEIISLWWKVY